MNLRELQYIEPEPLIVFYDVFHDPPLSDLDPDHILSCT